LNIAREIGMVLGFVSIFLVWRAGRPDLLLPNITLAALLDPNRIWIFLESGSFQLGVIGGLLFLGGCIALLFTRWGVVGQILGLIAFLIFYSMLPYGYGSEYAYLGIGFYVGALSAVVCFITGFVLRGGWFSRSARIGLKQ
jgi:hypothetical protein